MKLLTLKKKKDKASNPIQSLHFDIEKQFLWGGGDLRSIGDNYSRKLKNGRQCVNSSARGHSVIRNFTFNM